MVDISILGFSSSYLTFHILECDYKFILHYRLFYHPVFQEIVVILQHFTQNKVRFIVLLLKGFNLSQNYYWRQVQLEWNTLFLKLNKLLTISRFIAIFYSCDVYYHNSEFVVLIRQHSVSFHFFAIKQV